MKGVYPPFLIMEALRISRHYTIYKISKNYKPFILYCDDVNPLEFLEMCRLPVNLCLCIEKKDDLLSFDDTKHVILDPNSYKLILSSFCYMGSPKYVPMELCMKACLRDTKVQEALELNLIENEEYARVNKRVSELLYLDYEDKVFNISKLDPCLSMLTACSNCNYVLIFKQ